MAPQTDEPPTHGQPPDHGAIYDRRVQPPGVLPRHVQMWVMVAIAVADPPEVAAIDSVAAFAESATVR